MMSVATDNFIETVHAPVNRMVKAIQNAMRFGSSIHIGVTGEELNIIVAALQSFAVDKCEPKDQHPAIDNAIKVFELAATTPHKDLTTGQRKLLKLIEQTYQI